MRVTLTSSYCLRAAVTDLKSKKTHQCFHTYQFVVVYHHQLDVLGLSLDGALASPHLEGKKKQQQIKPTQPDVSVHCHNHLQTKCKMMYKCKKLNDCSHTEYTYTATH